MCYISGYTNVWKQKFTEERKWSNGNCTRLDNKVLRKALIGSWANKPEPWMQSGPFPLTRTKQVKDKSRKEKSQSRATNWRLPYGENVVINGDLKIHAITVNGCGLPWHKSWVIAIYMGEPENPVRKSKWFTLFLFVKHCKRWALICFRRSNLLSLFSQFSWLGYTLWHGVPSIASNSIVLCLGTKFPPPRLPGRMFDHPIIEVRGKWSPTRSCKQRRCIYLRLLISLLCLPNFQLDTIYRLP